MDKVYYLLRNNRKTGPFTIGELMQQSLRPADLIWVEGKSQHWTRMSEMELMPHVADYIPAAAPVITLSPEAFKQVAESDPHPVASEEAEPIEFIDHRRERHQAVREFVAAALVTVFVVAGVAGGRTLFLGKRGFGTPAATAPAPSKLESSQEYAARQAEPERVLPADTAAVVVDSTLLAAPVAVSRPVRRIATADTASSQKEPSTTTAISSEAIPPPVTERAEEPRQAPAGSETAARKKAAPDTAEAASGEGEKKRGFLRGLFKKKKKDGGAEEKEGDKEN